MKNTGKCQNEKCSHNTTLYSDGCEKFHFAFNMCPRFCTKPKVKRGARCWLWPHRVLADGTAKEAAKRIGISDTTVRRLRKEFESFARTMVDRSTYAKIVAASKPQDPPLPNQSLLGSKHHLINKCRTPKIGELCVSIGGSMILRVDKNVESHPVFGTRRHIVEKVPEMVICDHAEDCFDPTCDCFFRTKHTKEGSFLLQLCMGQKVKRIPVSEVEEPAKWDYDPKTYPLSINSLGGVTITSTPLKPQRYTHIGAGDGEGRTCTHFLDPAGHEQDLPLVWERDDEPGYRGVMCPETHPVLCASAVYQRIEVTA